MEINPYEIYLVAELSKLKNTGDVSHLLEKVEPNELKTLRIPYNIDLIKQCFSSKNNVESYVKSLTVTEKKQLTQLLSVKWRNNNVYAKISRFENHQWKIDRIDIDLIYIGYAEPKLKPLFRKHNMKLTDITNDNELWQNKPYRSWNLNPREVEYLILLAVRQNINEYRVFDGVHRAIGLVKNGNTTLNLCFPDKKIFA